MLATSKLIAYIIVFISLEEFLYAYLRLVTNAKSSLIAINI